MANIFKYKIKGLFSKVKRGQKAKQNSSAKTKTVSINEPKKKFITKNFWTKVLIVLCVGLVLYYIVPVSYNFITLEFQKGPGDNSDTQQDLSGIRTNIALIGVDEYSQEYRFVDAVLLLSYDYSTKQLGVFSVNPDLRVNIPGINRQMEIRRILNYTPIKGKEMGYLISTLESVLAVKIDRYMYLNIEGFADILNSFPDLSVKLNKNVKDTDTLHLPDQISSDYSKGNVVINPEETLNLIASDANGKDDQLERQVNTFSALFKATRSFNVVFDINNLWLSMVNNVKTNMTKLEIVRLAMELPSLRDDTIKKGYSRSSSYFKWPSTSLYGSYMVNVDRLDKDISSIFFNVEVFKEQARIEVFNGTSVRGLAGNRSRWLVNMGGNVVKIGNAEDNFDKVFIYSTHPEDYPVTISEIGKIFPVEIQTVKEKYYSRQVGDIVIVIGDNYI